MIQHDPIKQRHAEFYMCEEAIIHLESDRPFEAMEVLLKLSEKLEEGLFREVLSVEKSKKIVEAFRDGQG
jgi:hypothetical protein